MQLAQPRARAAAAVTGACSHQPTAPCDTARARVRAFAYSCTRGTAGGPAEVKSWARPLRTCVEAPILRVAGQNGADCSTPTLTKRVLSVLG